MNTVENLTEQARNKLITVLALTMVISVMNGTMYNIALPTISAEFALTNSQVSWMITAYIIVYAIGSVVYGKLADKYQLKNLITIGLSFFALGSLVGLVAVEYGMVIMGRVLQAVGASVIPAASMIIPVRYIPEKSRGRALGVITAGMAFGAAIGPVLSGLLMSIANWRILFAFSIIIIIAIPFFRKFLANEESVATKTDIIGGTLLGGTVASLLLAVTFGSLHWMILGLVLMILFFIRIVYADEPFVRLELFKNKKYTIGLLISFSTMTSGFIVFFSVPFMFTELNALSPFLIGLAMFPGAISAALLARRGGRLADEKGNTYLVTVGGGLLFAAFLMLSIFAGSSPWLIPIFLIVFNIGLNFVHVSITNTISRTLPKGQTGVGMGLMMMFNFIAGATITVFIGKVLDFGTSSIQLNPFLLNPQAVIYSNIFLTVAVVVAVMIFIYHLQYGRLFPRKEPKFSAEHASESSV